MVTQRKRSRCELEQASPKIGAAEDHNVKHISVPKGFLCPLTMDIMFEPVLDAEGNTYERSALMEWLNQYRTSPISRQPLSENMLIPNNALRDTIHEVMGEQWVLRQREECGKINGTKRARSTGGAARAKIDSFLQFVDFGGLKLSLNERGCCAFRFNEITVVLDVPQQGGMFCLYTRNLVLDITDRMKDLLLEMNFSQGDTRGGCLSVKKHQSGKSEVMFSYTDRVAEVSARDFKNIILNFVETATSLRTKLHDQEGPNNNNNNSNLEAGPVADKMQNHGKPQELQDGGSEK